ncbi:MAG: hypothetical protein M1834_008700 [Cirrosporium novae-zelandiae]|nr:MAG: hypothetical protein M1834_008700 [Cirrosporium novae-zelandiae]
MSLLDGLSTPTLTEDLPLDPSLAKEKDNPENLFQNTQESSNDPNEESQAAGSDEDEIGKLVSDEGERMLAFVDELRKLDAFGHIDLDLPQLVVVGNTSSGKSSVLQSLVRLPYPVSSDLCTSFATETIIRRCGQFEPPGFEITIKPGKNSDETRANKLRKFKMKFNDMEWNVVHDRLKDAITTAYKFMLPNTGPDDSQFRNDSSRPSDNRPDHGDSAAINFTFRNARNTSRYPLDSTDQNQLSINKGCQSSRRKPLLCEDVMTITVSKQSRGYFSIVDIPGLLRDGASEDVALSYSLAKKYIKNKRAIVLAVVHAADATSNQEVLSLIHEQAANKADLRTVGVVTKLDRVELGDQSPILELLSNRQLSYHFLKCGWFAVKNRSTKDIENDITFATRDENEQSFFNEPPWCNIDKNFAGIGNLKQALSRRLHQKVREEFPVLIDEMRQKLSAAKLQLEEMGCARDNPRIQRIYLSNIQRTYETLTSDWLTGNYLPGITGDHPSKLRYRVEGASDDFETIMCREGLRFSFRSMEQDLEEFRTLEPSSWEQELLNSPGVYSWILKTCKDLRGKEPRFDAPYGTKQVLFREQTVAWEKLSYDYLNKVKQLVYDCNDVLWEEACPEMDVRRRIQAQLIIPMECAITRAYEELEKLLEDKNQVLQTRNPMVANHPSIRDQLVAWNIEDWGRRGREGAPVSAPELANTLKVQGAMRTVLDLRDWLKAFGEVAMWRWIDDCLVQVVERHLLSLRGPLRVFSADWVNGLSDAELDSLVGEDNETKERRKRLEERVITLDKAILDAVKLMR